MISHWNSYKTALFNEYYVEQDSLVIPGHFSTKGLVNFPKALLERANVTRPLPGELRPSLHSGPAAKAASVLCWDTPPRAAWLPLAVSSGSHWWCRLPFPVTILPWSASGSWSCRLKIITESSALVCSWLGIDWARSAPLQRHGHSREGQQRRCLRCPFFLLLIWSSPTRAQTTALPHNLIWVICCLRLHVLHKNF